MTDIRQPASTVAAEIRTIHKRVSLEVPRIKGSRFIAAAVPIRSPAEAVEVVTEERKLWRGASHHCFAWRLGDTFRMSDDGEPSGTAGRPILRQIDARQLSQTIVVVSRYFGGTKLGTGGLIRAYGGAASSVLDIAEVQVRPITEPLRIRFPYELTPLVEKLLHAHDLEPIGSSYDERVTLELLVPINIAESVSESLRDACSGRLRFLTRLTRS